MSISLRASDDDADVGNLALGLFRYDDINRGWYEVRESSNAIQGDIFTD